MNGPDVVAERSRILSHAAHVRHLRFVEYLVGWNGQRGLRTPWHHRRIADWLDAMWGRKRRLLLMAFRGAGKSTVVGLFCAWLLTVWPHLRLLTLSADEALARRMLRTARKTIEQHQLSGHVRPARPEQWSAERFSVAGSPHSRDASMLAAGLEGNITGARADVIVCDDVEVPKTCATPALRVKLRERLSELEFVLTPGGTQLFAGTPHAWDSIYGTAHPDAAEDTIAEPARGAFLAGYERFDLPVMDAAGAPRWPEKFDRTHIETLRRRAGPVRFASQMMLQPADAEETRLDIRLIRPYEAELDLRTANGEQILFLDGRKLRSASCWWDPAYGGEKRRDASAIACVFTDVDGHHFIHDVRYLRHDSLPEGVDEATAQCRQVVRFIGRNKLTGVTVEDNGVGQFLPGVLRRELRGLPVAVKGQRSHEQKAARILKAFDARLAAGVLHAHRDVLAGPFGGEIQSWRPAKGPGAGQDDALDAVAGCLEAEPTIIPRIAPRPRPRPGWRTGSSTYRVTTE